MMGSVREWEKPKQKQMGTADGLAVAEDEAVGVGVAEAEADGVAVGVGVAVPDGELVCCWGRIYRKRRLRSADRRQAQESL